jgi:hypothetical protein
MQVQNFTHQRPDANIVIYHGNLLKPGDADRWTENNSALWDDSGANVTKGDSGTSLVGSFSFQMTFTAADNCWYPNGAKDLDWEIDNLGGRYNIPTLNFKLRSDTLPGVNTLEVWMETEVAGGPDYYRYQLNEFIPAVDEWQNVSLPLGPYAPTGPLGVGGWSQVGNADWNNIDAINFEVNFASVILIDGLHISGWILRGAKALTSGGAAKNYHKMKLITDDVAKDDSLISTDDSYPMGMYAAAELFRCCRSPVTGIIKMPMQPTILAGQLAHIDAAKHSGGFRIDKDMRIMQHRIIWADPCMSVLQLTDDLKNAQPLSPLTRYNKLLQATSPEFQNRQISSIKTRQIDVTQPIMWNTYNIAETY